MSQALITQFLIGLSVVAILVIAAIGLAVIFGVAGVINMAHGEFIMVGAYTAAVVGQLGGNTFIAIPVAFIVVGSRSGSSSNAESSNGSTIDHSRRCSRPGAWASFSRSSSS